MCYDFNMISNEDVKKLASLARIKVTEEEVASLAKDMENILDYVAQVQQVSGAGDSKEKKERNRNVLRDDMNPHESGAFTEEILNEAPRREGNYLKVKKIL
jgi:aspartyl-tRNA(Asn)/glutamyl-tRNA(Gln) amidotransferase subunit C